MRQLNRKIWPYYVDVSTNNSGLAHAWLTERDTAETFPAWICTVAGPKNRFWFKTEADCIMFKLVFGG